MLMTTTTVEGIGSMSWPQFHGDDRPPCFGRCQPVEVVRLDGSRIAAVRLEEFFTVEAARALHDHLARRLVYERDEIDDQKRTNRAARVGDLPGSALKLRDGAVSDPVAEAALEALTSEWLVTQLASWTGLPLRVLRPPTPYRLDPGDYIRPHDDRAAPEFRLSVSCCLTPENLGSEGGETVVGLVGAVSEYEHPDFFFPLKEWSLRPGARVLPPVFNSALLLVLSDENAHEVKEVAGAPRYSITTLYGDGTTA
jgi:hypothetical protein